MAEEKESFLANFLADEFMTKPISDYAALIKAIKELSNYTREGKEVGNTADALKD